MKENWIRKNFYEQIREKNLWLFPYISLKEGRIPTINSVKDYNSFYLDQSILLQDVTWDIKLQRTHTHTHSRRFWFGGRCGWKQMALFGGSSLCSAIQVLPAGTAMKCFRVETLSHPSAAEHIFSIELQGHTYKATGHSSTNCYTPTH